MKLGKYLHYKGKYYEVIGEATHSETLEKVVIYYSLSKNMAPQRLWARPKKMFSEKVEVNGRKLPRFKYLTNIK